MALKFNSLLNETKASQRPEKNNTAAHPPISTLSPLSALFHLRRLLSDDIYADRRKLMSSTRRSSSDKSHNINSCPTS
nr:hypothetical protein Iba_scaffold38699CG0350 [Ipomoea batatas]GMD83274.1 hypothetical protein Iba_chr14aCG3520 [Ipomoea batatas]GMD86459.1 hypothetical protein Iba_chr14bCG6270 [Ipomoea batatas]